MRIRTLLTALGVLAAPGLALHAQEFQVVVKAYEVQLGTLRLPQNSSGTLTFKACDQCDYKTVRVTPSTRYEANGKALRLEDFRRAVANLGNNRDTAVTVKHQLRSDTITEVRIKTF